MKIGSKIVAVGLGFALLAAGCTQAQTDAPATGGPYAETVTLGEYKGLTLHAPAAEVTDGEVDAYIDSLLAGYAEPGQITDRPIADGDTVNIDYMGLKDGVAFDGGTAQGQTLAIGSGQFIPGFEEGLVGANPGDQVDLNLTFPEDYGNAELAGQAVVFEVKVNYIHSTEPAQVPEFNDEWVAANTEMETAEEFRSSLKEQMLADAESKAETEQRNTLITTVVSNATIASVDETRVEQEFQEQSNYYAEYAQSYGVDMAGFLEMLQMTQEQFDEETQSYAEEYVRTMMVLTEIGHREGIALTDEEKEELSVSYGYTDYQHFVDTYSQQKVDEILLMEKVENYLMENTAFDPVVSSEAAE